ncbi:unnamed protein product [Trypanosoma congolense IL3000]|uniref:WGS project CAEQ00000000 data, annotated contig 1469 n=1 Tax=Trypanosoma congolense (strain IL3000) TaxID=1068625 RepID=F9W6H8_TRYCI|nr:unnamed protein product [Trypanosoma congolense IL3000]
MKATPARARQGDSPRSPLPRRKRQLPAPLQREALSSDPSTPMEHKSVSLPPPPPPHCDLAKMAIGGCSAAGSGDGNTHAEEHNSSDIFCGTVPIFVDDLIAYEYIDDKRRWQWGLATVVALPAPRLVQLMLWKSDDEFWFPPAAGGGSRHYEKAGECRGPARETLQRQQGELRGNLAQLREQRARVQDAMDGLNKRLAVRRLTYNAHRQKVQDTSTAAEHSLMEAQACVMSINVRDWREIRSYRDPPAVVRLVMEAVLVVLGKRGCGRWSWAQMQSAMRDTNFLRSVERSDSSHLGEAAKQHIRKNYMGDPRFTYDNAMKGSQALGYLQQWVVAQVETATAREALAAYDEANGEERATIAGLEEQLAAMQRKVDHYDNEEKKLRAALCGGEEDACNIPCANDGDGVTVDVTTGFVPNSTDGNGSEANIININSAPTARGCDGTVLNGDSAIKVSETTCGDKSRGETTQPTRNGASASYEKKLSNHEAKVLWVLTEELGLVLRSSILYNFNRAERTAVHLTHNQTCAIEKALRQRGPGPVHSLWAMEQRASDTQRDLQNALEDLRAQHGQAQRSIQQLESGNRDLMIELEQRELELQRLNQAIHRGDIPFAPPNGSLPASTSANSPGGISKNSMYACTGETTTSARFRCRSRSRASFASARTVAAPARPCRLSRLSLEEDEERWCRMPMPASARLPTAKKSPSSTTAALQVQSLEGDLQALVEELRYTKEELNRFRRTVAPGYYTSAALIMNRRSSPDTELRVSSELDKPSKHNRALGRQGHCDASSAQRQFGAHQHEVREPGSARVTGYLFGTEAVASGEEKLKFEGAEEKQRAVRDSTIVMDVQGGKSVGGDGRTTRACVLVQLRGVAEGISREGERLRREAGSVEAVLEDVQRLLGSGSVPTAAV